MRTGSLAVAAIVVALLPTAADAAVITPKVVSPTVVTPQAVTQAGAAPVSPAPSPAPAPVPAAPLSYGDVAAASSPQPAGRPSASSRHGEPSAPRPTREGYLRSMDQLDTQAWVRSNLPAIQENVIRPLEILLLNPLKNALGGLLGYGPVAPPANTPNDPAADSPAPDGGAASSPGPNDLDAGGAGGKPVDEDPAKSEE